MISYRRVTVYTAAAASTAIIGEANYVLADAGCEFPACPIPNMRRFIEVNLLIIGACFTNQ
jgi:hypothetical protein